MKAIISIILLIISSCCVPCYAQDQLARMNPYIAGGVSAAASAEECDTQAEPNDMETGTGSLGCFNASNYNYMATKITAVAGSTSICGIQVNLKAGAAPSFESIAVYIYDDNAGSPGNMVATFSSIATSELTTSLAWVPSSKSTGDATLTATNAYWVVLYSADIDSSDPVEWGYEQDCATEELKRSGDGLSWSSIASGYCFLVKLYK